MYLTEFLADLRYVVDDSQASAFSDNFIVAQAHRKIQRLFRRMTTTQEGYHFVHHEPKVDSTIEVDVDTKEVRLPAWVSKVREVREVEGASGANRTLGNSLPRRGSGSTTETSWSMFGDNRLRLHWWSSEKQLRLIVSKTPPPMIRFTVTDADSLNTRIIMPASLTIGVLRTEADWYANERFVGVSTQFTPEADHGIRGREGYVTSSAHGLDVSGSPRTLLTFSESWPNIIKVGDVFESVVPLPEELTRLAVLETAMVCFQHHGNKDAQVALMDELREERRDFDSYIMQNQIHGPDFYLEEGTGPGRRDQNKDNSYYY